VRRSLCHAAARTAAAGRQPAQPSTSRQLLQTAEETAQALPFEKNNQPWDYRLQREHRLNRKKNIRNLECIICTKSEGRGGGGGGGGGGVL